MPLKNPGQKCAWALVFFDALEYILFEIIDSIHSSGLETYCALEIITSARSGQELDLSGMKYFLKILNNIGSCSHLYDSVVQKLYNSNFNCIRRNSWGNTDNGDAC